MIRLPKPSFTAPGLTAAVGGGVASALLSMLTTQRPPLTVVMGLVAPLPIMIAALGFDWAAGLVALLVGAIFVGAFDVRLGHLVIAKGNEVRSIVVDVLVFLVTLGLPSWVLCLLASVALPKHGAAGGERMRPEERLLGRIVIAAVVLASLSVGIVFAVAIAENGGYDALNTMMVDAFDKMWKAIVEARSLSGFDTHELARQLTWTLPPMMGAGAVLFYVSNLWLAARISQTSGLLGMPWPDIPRHLRLPRFAALVLAVSLGLSFVGGPFGLAARIISAALLAAMGLQGLAVIHAVTRGKSYRRPLLIIVYMTIVMLTPWPLVFWGLVGLLDTAFSFRDRQQPTVVRKT